MLRGLANLTGWARILPVSLSRVAKSLDRKDPRRPARASPRAGRPGADSGQQLTPGKTREIGCAGALSSGAFLVYLVWQAKQVIVPSGLRLDADSRCHSHNVVVAVIGLDRLLPLTLLVLAKQFTMFHTGIMVSSVQQRCSSVLGDSQCKSRSRMTGGRWPLRSAIGVSPYDIFESQVACALAA